MAPRVRLDPRVKAMSEAQLQSAIVDFALLRGWLVTFTPDWMRKQAMAQMNAGHRRGDRPWPKAGTPDLICARAGRLVIAELKSHDGEVKPAQWDWIETAALVPGVEAYIWRPEDWVEGAIDEVLS